MQVMISVGFHPQGTHALKQALMINYASCSRTTSESHIHHSSFMTAYTIRMKIAIS